MPLNRVVALATALLALVLAALPALADLDWTSTAGIIAGLIAVLGIVQKWLEGWQKHEAREALTGDDAEGDEEPPEAGEFPVAKYVPDDEGDQASASAQGRPEPGA